MVIICGPSLTILFTKFSLWSENQLAGRSQLFSRCLASPVLGGEHGLNIDEITWNVVSSPLSYILAFVGAFIWATYCTVCKIHARGKTASPCLFY